MTNNYFLTKLYTYFVYNIFYIRKYENSTTILICLSSIKTTTYEDYYVK